MADAARNRKSVEGLFGLGGGAGSERCQDEFVSRLTEAVKAAAASGLDSASLSETLDFMFSRALAGREKRSSAYWMLLASHTLALPLVDMLDPGAADAILAGYEADYPRRERLPAQKAVIKALKARAKR